MDKDGVDIILNDTLKVSLDFNFSKQKLDELDNRTKHWDLQLHHGREHIGHVIFNSYQFLSDGIERRTIGITLLEIKTDNPSIHEGVLYYVINTVTSEYNKLWGEIQKPPIIFIETRHFKNQKYGKIGNFFKKIGEHALENSHILQTFINHDEVLLISGDDITIQLIEGHLLRSN